MFQDEKTLTVDSLWIAPKSELTLSSKLSSKIGYNLTCLPPTSEEALSNLMMSNKPAFMIRSIPEDAVLAYGEVTIDWAELITKAKEKKQKQLSLKPRKVFDGTVECIGSIIASVKLCNGVWIPLEGKGYSVLAKFADKDNVVVWCPDRIQTHFLDIKSAVDDALSAVYGVLQPLPENIEEKPKGRLYRHR